MNETQPELGFFEGIKKKVAEVRKDGFRKTLAREAAEDIKGQEPSILNKVSRALAGSEYQSPLALTEAELSTNGDKESGKEMSPGALMDAVEEMEPNEVLNADSVVAYKQFVKHMPEFEGKDRLAANLLRQAVVKWQGELRVAQSAGRVIPADEPKNVREYIDYLVDQGVYTPY